MRILILGTSNSLLSDGWVSGFQMALPNAAIENVSVGASPGIQFCDILGRDLSSYDLVLFDSIPNDEEYETLFCSGNKGYSKPEFTDEILFQILSTITRYCPVIVIAIAHKNYFYEQSPVFVRRRRLAQSLGCQFVDFVDILQASVAEHELAADHVYEIASHPARGLARQLGFFLGSDIRKYGPPNTHYKGKDFSKYFHSQKDFGRQVSDQRVAKSSIMQDLTNIIKPGSELQLDLPGKLIGLYINITETNCAIILNGDDMINISMYYHEFLHPGKLWKVFIPIPHGIGLKSLRVVEHVSNPDIKSLMSMNDPDRTQPSQLSLISLNFWSGAGLVKNISAGANDVTITHINDRIKARYKAWSISGNDLAHVVPSNNPLLRAIRHNSTIAIATAHKTFLCFDRLVGRVLHLSPDKIGSGGRYLPVLLLIFGNTAGFLVRCNGLDICLTIDSKTKTFCTGFGQNPMHGEFIVKSNREKLTFEHRGRYLSATVGGEVISGAETSGPWESFSLEPLLNQPSDYVA